MALSETQKTALIIHQANGASIKDIAARFGYTYQGIASLLRSKEMMAKKEAYLAEITKSVIMADSLVRTNMMGLIEKSVNVALSESRDASGERKFLINKVWPDVKHHRVESETTHRLDSGALGEEAIGLLKDLRANLASGDRGNYQDHVLEGEAALPDAVAISAAISKEDPEPSDSSE